MTNPAGALNLSLGRFPSCLRGAASASDWAR